MINQPEILEDILSRLPAKSIGRFRCVSKPWKALLSQPEFIKTHLNRTKQSPFAEQSLFLITHKSNSMFTTNLKNAHHMFDVMGTATATAVATATGLTFGDHQIDSNSIICSKVASCDGLLLFENSESSSKRRLLLVNPTTKEFNLLPESPYAFDPDVDSYSLYGVGYDSVSDGYKVVKVFYYNNNDDVNARRPDCNEVFVNVYSVKNGTWKRAANSPYRHLVGELVSGAFVNGRIHWVAGKYSYDRPVIVAFDFVEEKFREVPTAVVAEGVDFAYSHLLSLGGCLSMYASYCEDYRTEVWVMKEYGVKTSWTKVTIVDTREKSFLSPLCLLGKEQVLLAKSGPMFWSVDEKLVVYNLKEESFKDIVVQGIPDEFGVGGTFTESLVSPHCNVEATREE